MLPTHLIRWFEKYGIDPTIGWEIVETVTQTGSSLDDIRDERDMLNHTFVWASTMTQAAYDNPTRPNLQSYIRHTLPVIYAIAPYLTTPQREVLIQDAGADTPIMLDTMYVMLDRPSAAKPYPPHDPMLSGMRARHERIDRQRREGIIPPRKATP